MVERMLADFDRSYDLCLVVFRFFNAVGLTQKAYSVVRISLTS